MIDRTVVSSSKTPSASIRDNEPEHVRTIAGLLVGFIFGLLAWGCILAVVFALSGCGHSFAGSL